MGVGGVEWVCVGPPTLTVHRAWNPTPPPCTVFAVAAVVASWLPVLVAVAVALARVLAAQPIPLADATLV